MKKSHFLTIAFAALAMVSCGNKNDNANNTEDSTTVEEDSTIVSCVSQELQLQPKCRQERCKRSCHYACRHAGGLQKSCRRRKARRGKDLWSSYSEICQRACQRATGYG